jgi:PEP-CTERM motif
MGAHARGRAAGGKPNQASVRAGPNYGRVSRSSLLAGASLVTLGALAAPDRALAQCTGLNQTISTSTTGPVLSTGGAITVTGSGSITGGSGFFAAGDGVDALTCGITTLTNQSGGAISGGHPRNHAAGIGVRTGSGQTIDLLSNATGATISGGTPGTREAGSAGVSNAGTIRTLSNGGAISGGSGALVLGRSGGAGVSNAGTITTLSNSGAISGGKGGGEVTTTGCCVGGAGVSNSGTITSLSNSGTIRGGSGFGSFGGDGSGGAGVSNAGTIRTLSNSGTIRGGNGTFFQVGGAGVSNAGTIRTLSNSGKIEGAAGAFGRPAVGAGGAGVSNASTITTLTNSGAISGGQGGQHFSQGGAGVSNAGTITILSNSGKISGGSGGGGVSGGAGDTGGAGVSNAMTIGTLTNSGTIGGGNGGGTTGHGGKGGAGGAGIANSGTIAALTNSGLIEGSKGGKGSLSGATGDAIYSAGTHASIGPITNSGKIIGNVVIDNQASVTVTGGSGKTFGSWTGGAITIGAGNLTFADGNTALGDDISVDGGSGTVTNMGALRLAALAPLTITGSFMQTASGVLGLDFAGDTPGQYGALAISGSASLDGGVGFDLTNGFRLAAGDTFDDLLMSGGALSGDFGRLSVDGSPCSATSADVWRCSNVGFYLDLNVMSGTPGAVDLSVVALASAGVRLASANVVPEPSTWAMLALGFLGLGGLGLRKRKRADEIGLQ